MVEFDIGGTWIRAYLRRGARTVRSASACTPTRSAARLRAVLRRLYEQVARGSSPSSVNVGVAGSVRGARVVRSRNIPALTNFSFVGLFPAVIKITVDNDARAFLRRALARHAALRRGTVLAVTLGTGVGRAVARDGEVRRLKLLERAEPWERAYQRRRFEPASTFAAFVASELASLVERYNPAVLVLGGGVVERKRGFRPHLMRHLRRWCRVRYVVQ